MFLPDSLRFPKYFLGGHLIEIWNGLKVRLQGIRAVANSKYRIEQHSTFCIKPSVYKYRKILMIQVSNNKTKSMKGLTHVASPCETISFLGLRFCILPLNGWILHFTLKSHRCSGTMPPLFWSYHLSCLKYNFQKDISTSTLGFSVFQCQIPMMTWPQQSSGAVSHGVHLTGQVMINLK